MTVDTYLYVGTYGEPILMGTGEVYRGKGKGIYVFAMDSRTGEILPCGVREGVPNASWLAADPDGLYLYAVNELDAYDGEKGGSVTSLRIEKDGSLEPVSRMAVMGRAPCWLCLDKSHSRLAVANYSSGSLSVLGLGQDGHLLPVRQLICHEGDGGGGRQEGPHMHCAVTMDHERYLVTADLGIDAVHVYHLDSPSGILEEVSVYREKRGRGPRTLLVHPFLPVVYAVNELDSTVAVLRWTETGKCFESLQIMDTLKRPVSGNLAAGMVISPEGKNLYISNRGDDSISVCGVDGEGRLRHIQWIPTHGKSPRGICMAGAGEWILAGNQDSDFLIEYHRDWETGILSEERRIHVPSPVALCTVDAGKMDI